MELLLCHTLVHSVILLSIMQVSSQKPEGIFIGIVLVTQEHKEYAKKRREKAFAILCDSLRVLCVTKKPAIKLIGTSNGSSNFDDKN
jgi:hypothetical protein